MKVYDLGMCLTKTVNGSLSFGDHSYVHYFEPLAKHKHIPFVYSDLVSFVVALFRICFSSPYAKTSICLAEEEEV